MNTEKITIAEKSSHLSKDDDNLKNQFMNSIELHRKTTDDILNELTQSIVKVDFQKLTFPHRKHLQILEAIVSKGRTLSKSQSEEFDYLKEKLKKFEPTKNQYLVICIEQLLKVAIENKWGLCKKNSNVFIYNGSYWTEIEKERFQFFLGDVALKMGVEKFIGKIHTFKEELYKQFLSEAYLPTIKVTNGSVLINLQNGTFEIKPTNRGLRKFDRKDFITHLLPFEYDEKASTELFQKYLDKVLPDKEKQKVLAEYCGYIFTKPNVLKLEKILLLYGAGANGKSVFFDVLIALLGRENLSTFSLQNLTNDNGYFRAKIGNKLVNYATELNGKFETDIFKQMASGEPIEARLPYGEPFVMTDYAKLIFNCNELPKDVELTNAYFRRFLIIGFDVTIPEEEQDKELANKIIKNELSGVFNWILEGLDRLLNQKQFSKCDAIDNARKEYEKKSDTVTVFLTEHEYQSSNTEYILISALYPLYKSFCIEDGYTPLGKTKFIERLKHNKFHVKRINLGNVAYLTTEI